MGRKPFSCLRYSDLILVIDNNYGEDTRHRRIVPCPYHCGRAPAGVAGVLHERHLRFYCHSGLFERDHSVSWDESPLETAATSERHHTQVACLACFRAAEEDGLDEGTATDEPTTTRLPEPWVCSCVSCGEQVPFGYSEPNRGGALWPITGNTDVWRRRDWLLMMDS